MNTMPTQQEIGQKIIQHATHFVGLYETKSNAEWASIVDKTHSKQLSDELETVMRMGGWTDGLAYCIAYAEAMWRLAYKELEAPKALYDSIFSKLNLSVMSSYNNFKDRVTKESDRIIPGAIFFMQKGSTASGHAGIVVAVNNGYMATIEGNTSPGVAASAEADRQGDGIYKKTRPISLAATSGLYIKGFLNPIAW